MPFDIFCNIFNILIITPLLPACLVDAIRNGIDVLVGTPGRIKDHIQNNKLDLSKLKHVVLDEVDQMLDMGFAEQVEEILAASYKKGYKHIIFYLCPMCFHVCVNGTMCSHFLGCVVCDMIYTIARSLVCRNSN